MSNIVLDLDECIIRTDDNVHTNYISLANDCKYVEVRGRIHVTNEHCDTDKSQGLVDKYWFIERPHLKEFLDFCMDYFDTVSVWSAGMKMYVYSVVDVLFNRMEKPTIVLTNDEVKIVNDVGYTKPLSTFYAAMKKVYPESNVNERNTLILDNRLHNFLENPHNGVHIPDWYPKNMLSLPRITEDKRLLQFKKWILDNDTKNVKDVRTLDKSKIFDDNMPSSAREFPSRRLYSGIF